MKSYTAKPNQSLMDVAIQLYGTPEALPRLAELNGIAVSAGLVSGQVIEHDAEPNIIATYYDRQGITVTTNVDQSIGAMIIGTTFIVQL